jgi:hypothetical protein
LTPRLLSALETKCDNLLSKLLQTPTNLRHYTSGPSVSKLFKNFDAQFEATVTVVKQTEAYKLSMTGKLFGFTCRKTEDRKLQFYGSLVRPGSYYRINTVISPNMAALLNMLIFYQSPRFI